MRIALIVLGVMLVATTAFGQCVTCNGINSCIGGNKLECLFIEGGCIAHGRCPAVGMAASEPCPDRAAWHVASVRMVEPAAAALVRIAGSETRETAPRPPVTAIRREVAAALR